MGKILVITNDFPPRTGGIQNFVYELVKGLDPEQVIVFCSKWRKSREFDLAQNFKVIRIRSSVLLPTKKMTRKAIAIAQANGCDRVLFGASAPLGLMSKDLKAAGIKKTIALTHGHEAGWAGILGLRFLLKKAFADLNVITYLGEYTKTKISPLVPTACELVRLTPGVDTTVFNPRLRANRELVLGKLGLNNKKIVFCASRLMPRKGQDQLLEIWPKILQTYPDAHLVFSGSGPYKRKLTKKVKSKNLEKSVTFLGTISQKNLATWYAASDIFAMPVRTRLFGFDVEGLGMVYLEAAASGVPTIGTKAGGVPDALVDSSTGFLIKPKNEKELIDRIQYLLANPNLARTMGEAGRDWVVLNWQWAHRRAQLKQLLEIK